MFFLDIFKGFSILRNISKNANFFSYFNFNIVLKEKGNKGAIKNIDKTLKMFDESSMDKISPTTAVNKAKKVINRY